MKIRRYYKKGQKFKYTISDEYYEQLVKERGITEANRIDNASKEIILESIEEEHSWFQDCLHRVYNNPRWYLDNLDYLPTFSVDSEVLHSKTKPL